MDKGVNFVQQMLWFMEFAKTKKLSAYDRIFWVALFCSANKMAMLSPEQEWPADYFPVGNHEFTALSGLEERNIRNIRNRLKQMGLLDFRKGNGKAADPEYRIHYMRVIGCRIVPDAGGNGCKNVPDTERNGYKNVPDPVPDLSAMGGNGYKNVPDTVPDRVPEPLKNKGSGSPINKKDDDMDDIVHPHPLSEGVPGEIFARMAAEGYEEREVQEVIARIGDIEQIRNLEAYLRSSIEYNRRRQRAKEAAVHGFTERSPEEYERHESPEEMLDRLKREMTGQDDRKGGKAEWESMR